MLFPPEVLEQRGLRYTSSDDLVIRRRKCGRGFLYLDNRNTTITCSKQKRWFKNLAVPPVYQDVHYCYDQKGHLQAKGLDTTGNSQYFYHPEWENLRDNYKFSRLKLIGQRLPRIRRKVNQLIREKTDDKSYVLAAITKVLDRTGLRIGNPESSLYNGTYRVTTLKNKHLKKAKEDVILEFTGKGGVEIEREIVSRNIKYILEDFYDRPGDMLFQYRENGNLNTVSPAQVNNFIEKISKIEMTAKEFRTWRASALFVKFWLRKGGEHKTLKELLEEVAEYIGNTPTTLRTSYIHPILIEKKKDPDFSINDLTPSVSGRLRKAERYLMMLIN